MPIPRAIILADGPPMLDCSRTLDSAPTAERARGGVNLILTVLAHPDLRRIGEQAALEHDAPEPSIHRKFPLFSRAGEGPRPLESRHVSRQPVLILRRGAGVTLRAGGERPLVVDGNPAGEHALDAPRLHAGVVIELSRRVAVLLRAGEASATTDGLGLIGVSPGLQAVREEIRRVSSSDHPVLLRGETGVGKERVAAAIHLAGRRARGPFVAVNCAAMPATTAPSQLFGHARGAFTGSVAVHRGYFGEAEGGTLFLDEIGEMRVEVQSMLLRALDTGETQPVGGPVCNSDLRVLSATDAPLEGLVSDGQFRPALLHRLGALRVDIPPLRARREDVPMLLLHFLRDELGPRAAILEAGDDEREPWLGADVILACVRHPWPGNTRELRAVARWIALHGADRPRAPVPPGLATCSPQSGAETPPRPGPVPPGLATCSPQSGAETPPRPGPAPDARRAGASDIDQIRTALEAADHRVEVAARALGLSRNTLRTRMRGYGIRRATDLETPEIDEARAHVGDDVAAMAAHLGVGEHALRLRIAQPGRG